MPGRPALKQRRLRAQRAEHRVPRAAGSGGAAALPLGDGFDEEAARDEWRREVRAAGSAQPSQSRSRRAPPPPPRRPETRPAPTPTCPAQSRKRVLVFMGPALIMPLGEPLMNVVDTVCLGQFAGTAELAAMGPACIIFAFAQYIFQALQISTVT
jgi:hypothetical protein